VGLMNRTVFIAFDGSITDAIKRRIKNKDIFLSKEKYFISERCKKEVANSFLQS